jgi:acetyl esterase/lipase
MSMTMDMTTRCSRAGAQVLRYGRHLANDAVGSCRTGALLLRGGPFAVGWLAGWLSAEFSPQVVTGYALSRVSPLPVGRVAAGWAAQRADRILGAALKETFGADYRDAVCHPLGDQAGCPRHRGMLHAAGDRRRYAAHTSNISYGPAGRDNLLDVWRHRDLTEGSRTPVLLQIPGGGWSINSKRGQAYPLMGRMAQLGWICVSINYRKSPRNAWPAHIVDVKRAIAWVRHNIAGYGGDPDFIAVTGGSAGGQLAALAALTANDRALQPGFERADTTVQAAAPYYGVYDLTDAEKMHPMMLPFLEQFVMQTRYTRNPGLFESASPISHAHSGAPPFFVLHGQNDTMIPSAQAQTFCSALRQAGASTVGYAELEHAHHNFDTVGTVRSQLVADAVADFLGVVYGRYASSRPGRLRGEEVSAS